MGIRRGSLSGGGLFLFCVLAALLFSPVFGVAAGDSCSYFSEDFSGTSQHVWTSANGIWSFENGKMNAEQIPVNSMGHAGTAFSPPGYFVIDADIETVSFLNNPLSAGAVALYFFTTGDILLDMDGKTVDGVAAIAWANGTASLMGWDVADQKWHVTGSVALPQPLTSIGLSYSEDAITLRLNKQDTVLNMPVGLPVLLPIDSLWLTAQGMQTHARFDNVCAAPLDGTPAPTLAAPQNLRHTLNGAMLTVQWDAVTGATGYRAGLGTSQGSYAAPADFGNITQVGPVDISGVPAGTYYLAVKAYNDSQESPYSNEIALTFTPTTFVAPQNLRYTVDDNMLTLLWGKAAEATGYKVGIGLLPGVYSGPADFGNITQLGPLDIAGVPDGTYYVAVKAYSAGQESPYSNEAAIKIGQPVNELSYDQKSLIASMGYPQYLTVVFNTDAQRREETWTYTGNATMYVFWNGWRNDEKGVTIDPTLPANPPSVNPGLFTKELQVSDLTQLFGSTYTVATAADVDPELATINFKTYFFAESGVFASFVDDKLAIVQTNDIPGNSVTMTAGRAVQEKGLSNVAAAHIKSAQGYDTKALMVLAIMTSLVTQRAFDGNRLGPFTEDTMREYKLCLVSLLVSTPTPADCDAALLFMVADLGIAEAEEAETQGRILLAAGPELLGSETTKPPCVYTYSDWSPCIQNSRTRTVVSSSPDVCVGVPELTQPCTSPQCTFQYTGCIETCRSNGICAINVVSFSPEGCAGIPETTTTCAYIIPECDYTYQCAEACRPDGTCIAQVTSAEPPGCTGTPASTISCSYTPPQCTGVTSSESACDASRPWDGLVGLGTVTTTHKGTPEGCVGGIDIPPPPPDRCCVIDCLH